jgi:hypothetical protein
LVDDLLGGGIRGDQRGDGEVVDGAGVAAGGVVDLVMASSENRSFWQSGVCGNLAAGGPLHEPG